MNNENISKFIKEYLANITSLNNVYKFEEEDLSGAGGYILKGTAYEQICNVKIFSHTIYDLNFKIIYSIKKALYFADLYVFDEDSISCLKEIKSYYYIENAIYRIISLWDMLGQILNIQYKIEENYERVKYKKILNKLKEENILTRAVSLILNYINEDVDYDDINKGNHQFVLKYRNKMAHRNSPNIFAFSNLDDEYKLSPLYLLQRLTLEFNEINNFLYNFIYELYKEITDEKNKLLSDETIKKNKLKILENLMNSIIKEKKELILKIDQYKTRNKLTTVDILKILNIDIVDYNNFEKDNSISSITIVNKIIDFLKIETTLPFLIKHYNE
ncbi:MAG: Cthe_2314 family HEPN domain-containing protein [Bacilli bacterium]|jgi:hypothetical protein|nr:Cthe_2314 family HEPN domain-containing protein [Bacilli bacterium]MDY0339520.1 Cthe_2314 family HEPN domain-containing protein [Acholeplasmataceae bacterium]